HSAPALSLCRSLNSAVPEASAPRTGRSVADSRWVSALSRSISRRRGLTAIPTAGRLACSSGSHADDKPSRMHRGGGTDRFHPLSVSGLSLDPCPRSLANLDQFLEDKTHRLLGIAGRKHR